MGVCWGYIETKKGNGHGKIGSILYWGYTGRMGKKLLHSIGLHSSPDSSANRDAL